MRFKVLIAVVLVLLSAGVAVLGQQVKLIKIDGDGDFHLGTKTLVADHVLSPGMYRVQMIQVNARDQLIFYSIPMLHFGKGMWPGAQTEIFRVSVTAEPAAQAKKTILLVVKKDKLQLAREIDFKCDGRRYILPSAEIR